MRDRRVQMSLLLILIILLVVLGGGGFYAGGPRVGGGAVGLILLIIIDRAGPDRATVAFGVQAATESAASACSSTRLTRSSRLNVLAERHFGVLGRLVLRARVVRAAQIGLEERNARAVARCPSPAARARARRGWVT